MVCITGPIIDVATDVNVTDDTTERRVGWTSRRGARVRASANLRVDPRHGEMSIKTTYDATGLDSLDRAVQLDMAVG